MTRESKLANLATRDIVENRFALTWSEDTNTRALAHIHGSLADHAIAIGGDPLPDYCAAYMQALLNLEKETDQ